MTVTNQVRQYSMNISDIDAVIFMDKQEISKFLSFCFLDFAAIFLNFTACYTINFTAI